MKKVLAGGRFNIIHPGHIHFLKSAKALGDYLVVVVANDRTVTRNKRQLLFPDTERKTVLESIRYVDKAVVGKALESESGYLEIIKREKPDIIALGHDQHVKMQQLKEGISKLGLKCKITRIKNFKGYKTKKIIKWSSH